MECASLISRMKSPSKLRTLGLGAPSCADPGFVCCEGRLNERKTYRNRRNHVLGIVGFATNRMSWLEPGRCPLKLDEELGRVDDRKCRLGVNAIIRYFKDLIPIAYIDNGAIGRT